MIRPMTRRLSDRYVVAAIALAPPSIALAGGLRRWSRAGREGSRVRALPAGSA